MHLSAVLCFLDQRLIPTFTASTAVPLPTLIPPRIHAFRVGFVAIASTSLPSRRYAITLRFSEHQKHRAVRLVELLLFFCCGSCISVSSGISPAQLLVNIIILVLAVRIYTWSDEATRHDMGRSLRIVRGDDFPVREGEGKDP